MRQLMDLPGDELYTIEPDELRQLDGEQLCAITMRMRDELLLAWKKWKQHPAYDASLDPETTDSFRQNKN